MDNSRASDIIEKVNGAIGQDSFNIKATSETPEIYLDKQKGKIKFSGRSLPEDAKRFYLPIKKWIEDYIGDPAKGTHVIFAFEYFNTASSKMIMEIMELISDISREDTDLCAEWHYVEEDDDMLEAGKDYEDITGLKFDYLPYE